VLDSNSNGNGEPLYKSQNLLPISNATAMPFGEWQCLHVAIITINHSNSGSHQHYLDWK
jgi:hypothetical protein